MMSDIIVKKSKIEGNGVFAGRNFKKGETVLKWHPKKLSKTDLKKIYTRDMKYVAYQDGKCVLMQPPERYVNHSCNANTTAKNYSDIAKRDIRRGEEITGDYGDTGGSEFFVCLCGNRNCRLTYDKISNNIIKEIKKNIHPSSKNKKNHKKFIDSYFPGGKAHGTRNPEVRKIARKYLKELKKDRSLLLKVSEALWEDGHIETRIIASIFIGAMIDDPRSIGIVKKWVPTLDNWANADLLMGETKKYWINNPKETLKYSEKLIRSKNPWDRRFGLIILIFPVRKGTILIGQATDIADKLKNDREKYVRKGYIWLKDQISKA